MRNDESDALRDDGDDSCDDDETSLLIPRAAQTSTQPTDENRCGVRFDAPKAAEGTREQQAADDERKQEVSARTFAYTHIGAHSDCPHADAPWPLASQELKRREEGWGGLQTQAEQREHIAGQQSDSKGGVLIARRGSHRTVSVIDCTVHVALPSFSLCDGANADVDSSACEVRLDAFALAPNTILAFRTTLALGFERRCVEDARKAVVATAGAARKHDHVPAADKDGRGGLLPRLEPHEEDRIAAEAHGHQRLAQVALGVVDVAAQGIPIDWGGWGGVGGYGEGGEGRVSLLAMERWDDVIVLDAC